MRMTVSNTEYSYQVCWVFKLLKLVTTNWPLDVVGIVELSFIGKNRTNWPVSDTTGFLTIIKFFDIAFKISPFNNSFHCPANHLTLTQTSKPFNWLPKLQQKISYFGCYVSSLWLITSPWMNCNALESVWFWPECPSWIWEFPSIIMLIAIQTFINRLLQSYLTIRNRFSRWTSKSLHPVFKIFSFFVA